MFATGNTPAKSTWLVDLLILTLLIGVFYAIWIGSYALLTPDEGRYCEVAREMVVSGDYITPRLDGVAFLDKPALYYWLQAFAIKLFGLNEAALRFWPAVLGVLGCLLTYLCGSLLFNRRTGILSAIILATCPLYYGGAHYANLDGEVAVWISGALSFFLLGFQSPSKRAQPHFFRLAYLFCALAFLTKGLIGIVFPIMIVGCWIILLNRWADIKRMRLVSGSLIFSITTLPWYILVQKANPQFLHYFFITQQVTRFLSKADFNSHAAIWFYVPIILAGCFAWGLFLLQAIWKMSQAVLKNRKTHPVELFLLIWFFCILLFFSIPKSKTIGYIMPVYPVAALIIGHYLAPKYHLKRIITWCTIICVIFSLALIYNAPRFNKKSAKSLAMQLKPLLKADDEVVIYYKYYHDLPLYLERRLTLVADWKAEDIPHNDNWVRELWYGMPFQDTQDWLIEESTFWKKWYSTKRLFVFININVVKGFVAKAKGPVYTLGESHGIVLVTNKKIVS